MPAEAIILVAEAATTAARTGVHLWGPRGREFLACQFAALYFHAAFANQPTSRSNQGRQILGCGSTTIDSLARQVGQMTSSSSSATYHCS
jgi:hypothetical protein